MTSEWKEASKELPECAPWNEDESDYKLCANINDYAPFVAWFNCTHGTWTTALPGSSNEPVTVTHWQELPEMPRSRRTS